MPRTKKTETADPPKKEGFPSLKKINTLRKKFVEANGTKIITASKVKELGKAMGLRMSADFPDALPKEIYAVVWKAAKRTLANDRKTISAHDL